jgi:glycosyltransferase involved in cell wall biosynthesis
MNLEKFLTIIIRVYNRASTIERCINSVLMQTYVDKVQVLIIDDASTDESLNKIKAIIRDNPHVNIELVCHKKNMGRGKALNTAKTFIKGKYCCVLDSDDEYNRNTFVEELYTSLKDKVVDILYYPQHDLHVNNVYLSDKFKQCPIPNFNYYEDHYTWWFFMDNGFVREEHTIPVYYRIIKAYNGLSEKPGNSNMDKAFGLLYEDVIYKKDKPYTELLERWVQIDTSQFSEEMKESFHEVRDELVNRKETFKF